MKFFSRKTKTAENPRRITRTEALAGIPVKSQSITCETLENGDILIEYPLNIRPFFLQLANRFSNSHSQTPTKKLQLDQMGSLVWKMFDGEKDVRTIIQEVAVVSGLSLQEAEISVTTFLRDLGRRGLLSIG